MAKHLAEVVSQVQGVAEELFSTATLIDHPMPTSEQVKASSKVVVDRVLGPVVTASIEKGHSLAEVEVYRSLLAARIELAFREKWAELDGRRVARERRANEPIQ